MNKLYWVNTKLFCGGVSVDKNGNIVVKETAPCYQWAARKGINFIKFKNILTYKHALLGIKELENTK
jgi:hypothetical protein